LAFKGLLWRKFFLHRFPAFSLKIKDLRYGGKRGSIRGGREGAYTPFPPFLPIPIKVSKINYLTPLDREELWRKPRGMEEFSYG
jgi:hypothetical protein